MYNFVYLLVHALVPAHFVCRIIIYYTVLSFLFSFIYVYITVLLL